MVDDEELKGFESLFLGLSKILSLIYSSNCSCIVRLRE
jgi:hypothetical protein